MVKTSVSYEKLEELSILKGSGNEPEKVKSLHMRRGSTGERIWS